jgi:hypothetical protein
LTFSGNWEQEEYFKGGTNEERYEFCEVKARSLSYTLEVTSCVRDTEVSGEYNFNAAFIPSTICKFQQS